MRSFIAGGGLVLATVLLARWDPHGPSAEGVAGEVPAVGGRVGLPKPTPVFNIEEIASGLRAPWELVFVPDGRVFFTEREGRVRVIEGGKLRAEPLYTVPDLRSQSKMGLLGLALSPRFAEDRTLFMAENHGDEKHPVMRVVRYVEEGGTLRPVATLMDGVPAFWNHTGGRLKFGPDGRLYITTGDADRPPLSQDLRSPAGKILRLNADGGIPGDNPFAGRADADAAVWTYGHRNPQGLAFQPGTGTLFAPEHGPDGGDEINIIRRATNYGWPVISHDRAKAGMVSPLLQYTPSIAPSGAMFYTGSLFPTLKGDLLVACLRGEGILRVQLEGDRVVTAERVLHKRLGRLREVVEAPDGSLWVLTSEFDPPDGKGRPGYDKIFRLTPAEGTAAPEALPNAADMPRPKDAAGLYAVTCAGCHGTPTQPGLHPSLFDGKWVFGGGDTDLRRVIHDGIEARGMPSQAGRMTDAEIDGLIRYIRENEKR